MDIADLHVLVVDDFPTMRKLLVKSLHQMGATTILEAGDGVDAVKLLETERVDLLVSDWNMPDMGGLELLRWVRQRFPQAHLPFLMVTSKGQQMDVVDAVRAGVDAYVVKPFTQEILEGKVAKLAPQAAEFSALRQAAVEAAEVEQAEARRRALGEYLDTPETPEPEPETPPAEPEPPQEEAQAAPAAETPPDKAPESTA
jgi:two-component system, chemotaxis family, chemotaxis protein CheY